MMDSAPRISVVVPAYNAGREIDRCLEALACQTLPDEQVETIVVDDGSSDDTAARAAAHPAVRLIAQPHAGPAAARNLGMRHARGEVVLFTDADCAPATDWIERMAAPFCLGQAASGAGAVAGVKGAYRTHQRELTARFVQGEYEEKYDRMARQESIDFVDTYAAGYRRDLLLSSGGFDTSFPGASVEDQELSFRLAEQGHRLVFVPEARVYHWGHPRSVWAYARKKLKIGFWKVLVHRKHPAKLVRDSHTPQSLRVQIVLSGLAVLSLLGTPWWPAMGWGAAACGVVFLLSTLPFVRRQWSTDRAVAVVSPFFLLVRALALGIGFLAGAVAQLLP